METSADLLRAVRIFHPTGPKPFAGSRFVNFLAEEQAALSVAQDCRSGNLHSSILTFGFPGNGRRAFAQRIAAALHDTGFFVVWIDVPALAARTEQVLKRDLQIAQDELADAEARPLLLVINELDAMKAGVKTNEVLADLKELLTNSLGEQCPPPILVLATARSPKVALTFLKSASTQLIYFPWPDKHKARELLKLANMPNSDAVANEVQAFRVARSSRYTTGSLVNGAVMAARIAEDLHRLKKMTPKERASTTLDFCTPTSQEEAAAYEATNEEFIGQAATFVKSVRRL